MYVQQLTLDKLPQKFNTLLDHAVGDTSKLAALLIMEQHLGNVPPSLYSLLFPLPSPPHISFSRKRLPFMM
jgi:hypothetical protein